MNEENKNQLTNENEESIEDILKSFQAQKDRRKSDDSDSLSTEFDLSMPEPPAKSERQMIDFSRQDESEQKESKLTALKGKLGSLKQNKNNSKAEKKDKPRLDLKKLNINEIKNFVYDLIDKLKGKISKRALLISLSITVIVLVLAGIIFGIASGVSKSRVAYLKPYQQKYSGVTFPEGIQEKYCDMFGQHPTSTGCIKLDEIGYDGVVLDKKDDSDLPYSEPNAKDCFQNNYVIYMNDSKLEEYYKDADSFNSKASGFITYSDFVYDYRFKVVGAFYTNTKAEDDNGYIFPYNVTEKQTDESSFAYIDRLTTRFLYDTSLTITRDDKLITVSCPTKFRKNFRFVVVGVLRGNDEEKAVAKEKSKVHYPQVIYDEKKEQNPYRFAAKWYPEVIIMSSADTTKTSKQSIADYNGKTKNSNKNTSKFKKATIKNK